MSGLAALLAGHREPGIFRWHGAFDSAWVEHTVEHADWRFVHLDGWRAESKQEFLEAISSAFGFPDDAGRNFDILADNLHDVVAGDSNGTVFLWDGWGPFARADEQGFSVALSVLGGRVNADRGGRFAVLLRGEGPDLGIRSID